MEDNGGYVQPKADCPHCSHVPAVPVVEAVELLSAPCSKCGSHSENWVCLECHVVGCSRYVNGDMAAHNEATQHPLAISLCDLNVWCYACGEYILPAAAVQTVHETFHLAKHGQLPPRSSVSRQPALAEREEDAEVVASKAARVAELVRRSRRLVFFTAAGISTSANIPDFRGPNGVWTLRDQGLRARCVDLDSVTPTFGHRAIVATLQHFAATQRSCFVVSQNTDGLHRRSGVPAESIAELHGNAYIEICWECGKEFQRQCRPRCLPNRSGRKCEECLRHVPQCCHCTVNMCECGARLKDSTIAFGENLPPAALEAAERHCRAADVILVLGCSMTVAPANGLPWLSRAKVVIVNLQPTEYDRRAHIRIFCKTDDFFRLVMAHLQIAVAEC